MSYLPDDCSECRVCGVPIYGYYGGVCSNCEIPRDDKGRFVKRPAPPKWPEPGDRVYVSEGWRRDGFTGFATMLEDRSADNFNSGVMVIQTDAGERRECHCGSLKVVS